MDDGDAADGACRCSAREPLKPGGIFPLGPVGRGARACVHRRMPARPEQAAHELFAVLRELDAEGVQLIWVESRRPVPSGTAFATGSPARAAP